MRTLLQSTALQSGGGSGFNFSTGYGLIQVDSAMKTIAAPKPVIVKLVLPDQNVVPGTQPITVTVQGNYLNSNSVVTFRGQPLPTTVLNSTQAQATIPAFTGNPPIQVVTSPISANGNDGGKSDTLYFFTPIKKTIIVQANQQAKKYGEKIPVFTSTILVDSIPLANTGLTAAQLRLDSLDYTTPATSTSNVGIFFIRPTPHTLLDPTNPTDAGLLELYNYVMNDGLLVINKMPLVITPRDTTLTLRTESRKFCIQLFLCRL